MTILLYAPFRSPLEGYLRTADPLAKNFFFFLDNAKVTSMGVKLLSRFRRSTADEDEIAEVPTENNVQEKTPGEIEEVDPNNLNEKPKDQLPDENAQIGVQDVEAVTLVWSKASLISAFFL